MQNFLNKTETAKQELHLVNQFHPKINFNLQHYIFKLKQKY